MEGDSVARPEDDAIGDLTFGDVVKDVDAATERIIIIAEIVVEGELDDPATVEKLDRLARGRDLRPSGGRAAIDEVVVEPDPQLAVVAHVHV